MFVGAGLKTHIVTDQTMETGNRIGGDRFISMTDVRTTIGVADRGSDVERLGHGGALAVRSLIA